MFTTPSLNLSLVAPAQAQKHVTVNESFLRLDHIVQLVVQARSLSAPPTTPEDGHCYIVPENGTEAWAQDAQAIACFMDGAWGYIVPQEGWRAWSIEDEALLVFARGNWSELAGDNAQSGTELFNQLTSIGIQTDADMTNRLSLKSPASLFDYEENDHRLNINKQAEADNCSLIFQTQYTGHAEIGLSGSNDFDVKVSADGQDFKTAIQAKQNGDVSFPNGIDATRLVTGVSSAGGADTVLGPPNLLTVSSIRSSFDLVGNVIYLCPFYVDRPTEYLGGACAAFAASSTAGSVLRAGLYELGEASGSGWQVGERLADLGSMPVDVAGHKSFELDTALRLQPGWYLHAIGTNGEGVEVRALEWMTPGAYLFTQFSSGTNCDFRITGVGKYLFTDETPAFFDGAFPQTFDVTLKDRVLSTYTSLQMLVPKWKRWD